MDIHSKSTPRHYLLWLFVSVFGAGIANIVVDQLLGPEIGHPDWLSLVVYVVAGLISIEVFSFFNNEVGIWPRVSVSSLCRSIFIVGIILFLTIAGLLDIILAGSTVGKLLAVGTLILGGYLGYRLILPPRR